MAKAERWFASAVYSGEVFDPKAYLPGVPNLYRTADNKYLLRLQPRTIVAGPFDTYEAALAAQAMITGEMK